MVIAKIKRLLLHLQYNVIDICYVATNEHQQKQEIEEKVKPDINDPIFNFKREFNTIQKNSEYYQYWNSMTLMTQRIQKYCKYRVPFLSRIESLWQFGQLVEVKKFQQAERILEFALNHLGNSFYFFYTMFDRHLIQAFKQSNKCFQIFKSYLFEVMNFEVSKEGLKS